MKSYFLYLFSWLYACNGFAANFTLESSAFQLNSIIPSSYTCYGIDQSPPLNWKNAPAKAQSFALIVEDPDAPSGVWTHWIVFNIPPKVNRIEAGGPIPEGATIGKNSWGGLGYRGPCPSLGAHRYIFKLYALDKTLDLGEGAVKDSVLKAMTSHVLGSTELIGLYQKL